MEKHSRFLALALSLALAASLLPASALAEDTASDTSAADGTETVTEQQTGNTQSGTDNSEKAEDSSSSVAALTPAAANVAPVKSSETAPAAITDAVALKEAVAKGGEVKLGDNITLTSTLEIGTNTTIDTNGFTLTIVPGNGDAIDYKSDSVSLALNNSNVVLQTSNATSISKGIYLPFDGDNLILNNTAMTIKGFGGYAIYSLSDAGKSHFGMSGGSLNIEGCGIKDAEGGIDWDSGDMAFNSGNVSITGCGCNGFGAIYSGADIVFGNGTDSLTVNLENNSRATGVKNTIVLVGGKNLTINKNATVNIKIAGISDECRGINIGDKTSTVAVNGGTLNISKNADCKATTVYGINGYKSCTPALKVNQGGIVNIAGYSKPENALHNMYVTMNGGSMDLGGKFDAAPSATLRLDADAALNETLTTAADTTIDTNGSTLTIEPETGKPGILVSSGTLTLSGSADAGALTVCGSKPSAKELNPRGINCAGNLTIKSGTVNIQDTQGYGICSESTCSVFEMDGGTLNVTDCGKGTEGGFLWSATEGGKCDFLGGTVKMTGCGSTLYGCIYVGCPLTFGNGNDALNVNLENAPSANVKNTIVLVDGKNLTIKKNATVNICIAGIGKECRGINIGRSDSIVSVNGGTLNISKDADCEAATVYGIRGSDCKPNMTVASDSTVSISGCSDKSALSGMIVTIDGGSMNLGTGTDGNDIANAAAAGATSIKNSLDDDVSLQKISASSFTATVSKTDKDGKVTGSYNYSAKSDGKIYAWLPANRVSFYDSDKTTCLGSSAKSGNATWAELKAGAPSMSGKTNFSKWVDVDGKDIADSASVKGELKVYAVYTTPAPSVPDYTPSYIGPSYGPSSSGSASTPTDSGTTITDPDVPQAALPSALNSTVHFAYVTGYSDGTVRPAANITRAEVATMFYRLLTSEHRDAIFTAKGSFTDVNSEDWYNKAVSSMANGKYITGYTSSIFGGDRAITRAEFVAIASRFMDAKDSTKTFSDVPASFWAADYISTAVAYGWIDGYPDGSFKPNQPITRAEAIKIINTMLGRGTDAAGVMTGLKTWSDNADAGAWYYYDVVEATNDHTFTGARPSEKWTGLKLDYSYDQAKYETPDTSK